MRMICLIWVPDQSQQVVLSVPAQRQLATAFRPGYIPAGRLLGVSFVQAAVADQTLGIGIEGRFQTLP